MRRPEIAFAGHPDLELGPRPPFAIGIVTREIARRLWPAYRVVVFGAADGDEDGVRYRVLTSATGRYARAFSVLDRASADRRFAGALFASPLFYPRYAFRLARRLRDENVDVLHLHNFFHAIPIIRSFNPTMKIVLHMHCEWLSGIDPRFGFARLRHANAILGCSEYLSNTIRVAYPGLADRVDALYNGVSLESFHPRGAESGVVNGHHPTIIFAGRISPEKGLHVLIESMRLVIDRFPRARLEIVGPDAAQQPHALAALRNPLVDPKAAHFERYVRGNYLQQLRRLAQAVPGAIDFLVGSFAQDEVGRRLAGATILVNPSLAETFGMTLIEGMACGLPVVATRVGGMLELVPDGAGLMVPPNDPQRLADAICSILDDPICARDMGVVGRAFAERFAWNRIAARYKNMIARLGVAPFPVGPLMAAQAR